jgi:hypothetical protein
MVTFGVVKFWKNLKTIQIRFQFEFESNSLPPDTTTGPARHHHISLPYH